MFGQCKLCDDAKYIENIEDMPLWYLVIVLDHVCDVRIFEKKYVVALYGVCHHWIHSK